MSKRKFTVRCFLPLDGFLLVAILPSEARANKPIIFFITMPNIPIAIIEAKNNKLSLNSGMQQALDYAQILDIPSVYSSNGDGFFEHNKMVINGKIEQQLSLDEFPTPEALWQ